MVIRARPPLWARAGTMQRLPNPNVTLRFRIKASAIESVHAAVSRDVSKGAPPPQRTEPRPVNETDFTEAGIAEPGSEFPVPLWHRGVTN
jgi:hypothetical protein